jgi:putative ABC transport system permease protein
MRAFRFDLRLGLRLLRRYPMTSLVAVLTLALGIGISAAIFAVVDAVLVQALPYPDADRLVMVFEKRAREGVLTNPVAPADFLDWRRRGNVFQHIAAQAPASVTVTGEGEPEQVGTSAVSWAFFDVLGTTMAQGRTFSVDDEVLGRHRVVILSHGFWMRRYGGAPDAIGRPITINGNAWRIAGILPRTFRFVDGEVDLWVPLVIDVPGEQPSRSLHQFNVYARLKPDVTVMQAVAAMDTLGRQLETEYPDTNDGHGAYVMPARDWYVQDSQASLIALTAAVGLVVLIVCVNVANLLLVRAASRQHETAIRAALGASRSRLVVQSLVESLGLSLVGGVCGLGVALVAIEALPAVMPERISVVALRDLTLDARVLAFAAGLAVLTSLIFGFLPAWQGSRPRLIDALGSGGRGPRSVRRAARLTLVVTEIALATLTLVGAGLVTRSFNRMLATPLGFSTDHRLTVRIGLTGARHQAADQRQHTFEQIEHSLATIPGVTRLGGIDLLPLGGQDSRRGVQIEGRERGPDDPPTRMHPRVVTPGYFDTMAIDVVKGRGFTSEDTSAAYPVVVINETSARQFWPGLDPIGRRIRFGGEEAWRTIVGIARDVRHWGRTAAVNPLVYRPLTQADTRAMTFVLGTDGDPASLASAARQRLAAVDSNVPLTRVLTMQQVADESVGSERALMIMMTAFGALALVLAVIGIYGVMAQLVVVRVPEIGVRMSLGARPVDIVRAVLGEGFWQAITGLAIGLGAGVYLMTFADALLFGVQPWDPVTLAAVSVLLLGAALAACVIPAARAVRVDPALVLRQG